MNTITRCPSCATHYQVLTSDLQAAQGWLRCGQCGHVFDSTGLVLAWTPALVQGEQSVFGPSLSVDADLVADPLDRLVLDDLLKMEDRASTAPSSPDLDSFEQALSTFKPHLPVSAPQLAVGAQSEKALSQWWMRYVVLVLTLGLLVQLAFVQRHAIVATWPESERFVRHVCQSFACQVKPVRGVDGLVIDSSELIQKDGGYLLRWTIRNATDRVLAMTSLELTLMQGADKVVIRRVLLAEQTGAPEALAPNRSWSGELALTLDEELKFSDYRLLSFYP